MLRRAAFSPNIKERADCSAALFTAGRRAARAGRAHPGAPRVDAGVGARPPSTRSGADIRPGDQVILNDPFAGGTHLNDVTLVAPVLRRRRHGSSAGPPTGPTTPTSAARRPARCRPTRPRSTRRACASRRCCSRAEVRAVAARHVAHAEERRGDLDAQVGANVRRRRSGWPSSPDAAARRGRRLRRAAHAGRARRAARRHVDASTTCSTRLGPGARPAGARPRSA